MWRDAPSRPTSQHRSRCFFPLAPLTAVPPCGCFVLPPRRGRKKDVDSCRICNSTWQPRRAWWEPTAPRASRWSWAWDGCQEAAQVGGGENKRIVSFLFWRDLRTREPLRSGSGGVNCLEAGTTRRDGRRAVAKPRSWAQGCAGQRWAREQQGGLPWSRGGLQALELAAAGKGLPGQGTGRCRGRFAELHTSPCCAEALQVLLSSGVLSALCGTLPSFCQM